MTQKQGILIGIGACAALFLVCGGLVVGVLALNLRASRAARINVAQIPHTDLTKPETTTATRPPPTTLTKVPNVPAPPKWERDKVPSNDDLRKLTTDTLLAFDQTIKTKDAKHIQAQMAQAHQGPKRAEEILRFMKGFIDTKVDLSRVKDVAPTFNPAPMIDANGHLVAEGEYAPAGQKVGFRLEYAFENGEWKLLSHSLNVNTTNNQN